jgi:hypothetical protein
MAIKIKDIFCLILLSLTPEIAKSEGYVNTQTKTFTSPSIINGEGENFFTENPGSEDPDIDIAADWDQMISGSFGYPEDEVESTKNKNSTESDTLLDMLPPTEASTRLLDESSLPLLAAFGNPASTADQWPKGKTWQTGLLPVSRFYDLKGCKFNLTTGPISIAHYYKNKDDFEIRSDSVVPMTLIEPEAKGFKLFVSANADLFPELDPKSLDTCYQKLRGKIIPIGRFDLGNSTITLGKTVLKHTVAIASRDSVKSVQVYLYWPAGRNDPLLIDDSGLYPVLSTPIFEIEAKAAGSAFLEVIPHLNYQKGGKALTKAKLREFWGE